jgi:multiple sugar transport system permease protein
MVAKSSTTPAQSAEITSGKYIGKRKSYTWVLGRILLYVFVFAVAITSLIPFLWMVDTAFKPGRFSMIYPPMIFPPGMGLMNFREVLTQTAQKTNFLMYFRNTTWYSLWVVIGQFISCSLAAYAFARLKFPGRDKLFYLYLGTMMLPIWVVIIPQFVEMKTFGWYNTMWCMTVPGMFGSAFGTFLLRQFFITIPTELDDAALIDGANKFQIYYMIILPLAKSALTVLAVFTLLAVWNDFIWPLIMIPDAKLWTLTRGLQQFQGVYYTRWELIMAAGTMAVLPILVIFALAQKYFVEGITLTGLAGR